MRSWYGILLLINVLIPWSAQADDNEEGEFHFTTGIYYDEQPGYYGGYTRIPDWLYIPDRLPPGEIMPAANHTYRFIPTFDDKTGTGYLHNVDKGYHLQNFHIKLYSGHVGNMNVSVDISPLSFYYIARDIIRWYTSKKAKPLPLNFSAQKCAAVSVTKLKLKPLQDNSQHSYFTSFNPEARAKLLTNYADYPCEGYVTFLASFPEYTDHIEHITRFPHLLDSYFKKENRFSDNEKALIRTKINSLCQPIKDKWRCEWEQKLAYERFEQKQRLEQEHRAAEEKRLNDYWHEQQAQSSQAIDTLQRSWSDHVHEYEDIARMYAEYLSDNSMPGSAGVVRMQERHRALQESIANQIYTMQRYTVTKSICDLLAKHRIDDLPFSVCHGNQLQQALHKEFIAILDNAVDLEPRNANESSFCLPEFTRAAAACNQKGACSQALMIADYCWSVIDGVKKFGRDIIASDRVCAVVNAAIQGSLEYHNHEPITKDDIGEAYDRFMSDAYNEVIAHYEALAGADFHVFSTLFELGKCIATGDHEPFYDGVKQAGGSMYRLVRHPIDAVANIVGGAAIISYYLGKIMFEIMNIRMMFYVDPLNALVRTKDAVVATDRVILTMCNKFQEIPERELIAHTTAFATETATFHYGGAAIGKLMKNAGAAAKTSGALERVRELLQPIQEELKQIAKSAKEFFKRDKEVVAAAEAGESIGAQAAASSVQANGSVAEIVEGLSETAQAISKNGYYEVNGFKFSEYYYNYLWNNGRQAPSLMARLILENPEVVIADQIKQGFFKYISGGWEMVYNPITKEVWHLQPIKRGKI